MATERALKVVREAENYTENAENFSYDENSGVAIVEESTVVGSVNEADGEFFAVSSAFRLAFAVLAEVLVGTGRIVRHVSPNERPEERHEFENPEHKNVRGPGFPIF